MRIKHSTLNRVIIFKHSMAELILNSVPVLIIFLKFFGLILSGEFYLLRFRKSQIEGLVYLEVSGLLFK